MLVTLNEIMKDAEEKKYAVGLFNHLNLEMARGIIEAAEEMKSPIILGVAEVHLPIIPFEYAAMIMNHIAKSAKVPVCLHFDHGMRYSKILQAIKAGFSSVMYDGSALEYEENIKNTREISRVAHSLGVSVEAELGHVGMGDNENDFNCDDQYTRVEQVNDFIERADVDALAVAIGTAHGAYKVKPKLDTKRLADIYAVAKAPLVLHGGSGLTDEDFKNTVRNGIRKVNICTEMCIAAQEAYKNGGSLENAIPNAVNAVKEVVRSKITLFESNNRV
mgnify:CR=1 FL=1